MTDPAMILPAVLADEILRSYADVLRVGRLTLNGSPLHWNHSAANTTQLADFSSTFVGALGRLPELDGVKETDLHQIVHLFCKAVSINYALSELLMLLQNRLGARLGGVVSVRTSGPDGGALVDYDVRVSSQRRVQVKVLWRGTGNIICCNPRTAKRSVQGTMRSVETEFPIDLDHQFTPTYRIAMQLKRSRSAQVLSALACATSARQPSTEEVSPTAPLRPNGSECSPGSERSTACGTVAHSCSDCSELEAESSEAVNLCIPLSLEARAVKTPPVSAGEPQAVGNAFCLPGGLLSL